MALCSSSESPIIITSLSSESALSTIVDHGVGDSNLHLEGRSDSFHFSPWHCQCEYIVRFYGLGSCDSPSSFFLFFMLRAVGVGDARRSRRFFRLSSISSSSGKLLIPDENHREKEGDLPSVSRYATGSVMTGAV